MTSTSCRVSGSCCFGSRSHFGCFAFCPFPLAETKTRKCPAFCLAGCVFLFVCVCETIFHPKRRPVLTEAAMRGLHKQRNGPPCLLIFWFGGTAAHFGRQVLAIFRVCEKPCDGLSPASPPLDHDNYGLAKLRSKIVHSRMSGQEAMLYVESTRKKEVEKGHVMRNQCFLLHMLWLRFCNQDTVTYLLVPSPHQSRMSHQQV